MKKPFPLSVVAASAAGVPEVVPEYLAMPQDMRVFAAPRLPEQAAPALLKRVVCRLRELLARMAATDFAAASCVTEDLRRWPEDEHALVGDLLGFGEGCLKNVKLYKVFFFFKCK
jgi:hypothetical protein